MTAAARSLPGAKLGVVALVLITLAAAWYFGVFERLGEPRAFAQALVAMGVWGYLAFVGAYTVLQPFGVPGTIFIVAAPLIWPWQTAFALSMTGTMLASVVGFSFARLSRATGSRRVSPRGFGSTTRRWSAVHSPRW